MKGLSKPSAAIATPGASRATPEDIENAKDQHEYFNDIERLKFKRDKEMGKVAAMLGAAVMITDKTFPFLASPDGRQLSVTEWYPGLSIAVDKFFHFSPTHETEVAFKQAAFKKNGIKYGYLTPALQLLDLADQLGLAAAHE